MASASLLSILQSRAFPCRRRGQLRTATDGLRSACHDRHSDGCLCAGNARPVRARLARVALNSLLQPEPAAGAAEQAPNNMVAYPAPDALRFAAAHRLDVARGSGGAIEE